MSRILDTLLLNRAEDRGRGEVAIISLLYAGLALLVTALVIYGAYFGLITALILRAVFFSLVAAAGLLALGLRARTGWARMLCYALALVALVPGFHIEQSYIDIVMRGAMATPVDLPIFVGLMAVVFVLVRMALGWPLVIMMALALVYAWFGYLIPGQYGHGGYDLRRLASTLMLSTEGVYGVPMGVAVEYIFLFALLGGLLMKIGTGEVFVDIARGLTGRMVGGPGLSAALASAMLGTINGSAVANVVTTGTFTIPLMKRTGYSANLAGAIEAAASSAGQILPPVMGAAAFLMAEIIGVPYGTIALAALIPGLLYVLALMISVRLEAGRLGLQRDMDAGLALLWSTLTKRGYLLLPLIGLVGFLIAGYTPTRAAVMCIVAALLISPWRKDTRVGLVDLVAVCRDTLLATMPIIAAVAAAGAVIGVLNLTGLGLMLSGLIVDLGGTSILAILLLTAVVSFVLGMGLPTSAAYLLLAVLVAPALTRLGIEPIVAHMFIFYYGLVSAITPPVALAAFAAASISGGDANGTAMEAVRLGFVKLFVPFLFVSMPGLLMVGNGLDVTLSAVFATIGIVGLTIAFAGWFVRPMSAFERGALAVAALLVVWPTAVTSLDVLTVAMRLIGIAGLLALLIRLFVARPTPLESEV
ncbi:TRAP transporter fused permease subunit [Pseudooceanicola sediminis]|uniref:TRAP transporter fused permease subunit n=1 Tax=Pseudooceanicola sediminis TaxID=2211117 RepID=A0A399IYJ5_9RHOB|nr:TRAP transporter fused permease subunit [Pseudooceanicola sediminis]RII37329.1 TRAP transporter fused permease subunit [Pseudooceanicola sediminis]|tara:strand:- start:1009 stop:2943 length:1935 start_codon:yes stop_codon:yes gene_type:complete